MACSKDGFRGCLALFSTLRGCLAGLSLFMGCLDFLKTV